MKLTADDALHRLNTHLHGVLSTLHPTRGVDAVPVVYALSGASEEGVRHLGIPVDLVKPKASTRLRREDNLTTDPRASLLIDHWDEGDWTQLWWVRAELTWDAEPRAELINELTAGLVARYQQYENAPFAKVLVFQVGAVTGWAAGLSDT
jgi:PPOX class probable F420-dependent enzyme